MTPIFYCRHNKHLLVAYSTTNHRTFTFYPLEFLEVSHDLRHESMSSSQLLLKVITKLKTEHPIADNIESKIESFKHVSS